MTRVWIATSVAFFVNFWTTLEQMLVDAGSHRSSCFCFDEIAWALSNHSSPPGVTINLVTLYHWLRRGERHSFIIHRIIATFVFRTRFTFRYFTNSVASRWLLRQVYMLYSRLLSTKTLSQWQIISVVGSLILVLRHLGHAINLRLWWCNMMTIFGTLGVKS